MDELNKKIKKKLNKMNSSEQYKKMIEDTMKMISNNEIERDDHNVLNFKQKKKSKLIKVSQSVAAIFIIFVLGATAYGGVTRKAIYKYWKYWS